MQDINGDFIEVVSLCNGASPATMANLYCIVPMLSFTSTQLSLLISTPILAKVRALNSRGWGALSPQSTSYATQKLRPIQMSAPTRVDATTSTNSITVQWTALTSPDNGESAITSYNLQWDRGTLGFMYYDLLGATPYTTMIDFTVTNGVVVS